MNSLAKTQRPAARTNSADDAFCRRRLTYVTRGLIYGEMGKRAEALADCCEATKLDPTSHYAWANLGWEQYLAGQLPAAKSSDHRALELNGGDAVPRFNLALCLSVENKAAEAKKEYALALADSKDKQRAALAELKKAQAQHPNTPAIREALHLFAAAQFNPQQRTFTGTETNNDE